MSTPDARDAAQRALARAAGFAAFSAWVMLALGALSLLVSLRAPIVASVVISAAVLVNGAVELRFGRRLGQRDPAAPRWLALNQLALGLEVMAYAAVQSRAFGPEQIDNALRQPLVRQLIDALDPEYVRELLDMLPQTVRITYLAVGALALAGCIAAAAYYASRARCLRTLAEIPPEAAGAASSDHA